MNLFEIEKELSLLIDKLVSENGEIDEETTQRLEELQYSREQKLINYGLVIKNLQVDYNAIKEQKELFDYRMKKIKKSIDWLKDMLLISMEFGEEIKDPRIEMKKNHTQAALKINDENEVPKEYKMIEEIVKIDNTAIKNALKAGKKFDWCSLEEKGTIKFS